MREQRKGKQNDGVTGWGSRGKIKRHEGEIVIVKAVIGSI